MNRQGVVLREFVLHAEHHLLVRPSAARAEPLRPIPAGVSPSVERPSARDAVLEVQKQEWAQTLEEGHQRGYQEGYEHGLKQGKADGAALGFKESMAEAERIARQDAASAKASAELARVEHAGLQARWRALLEALPAQLESQMAAQEDAVVAAVFQAVCSLLGEHALSPEGARQHVRHTLASWKGSQVYAIHLHPDDALLVEEQPEFLAGLDQQVDPGLRIVGDPAVELGGCQLRSRAGGLDARLEVQLESLKSLLLSVRRSREQEGANP